MLPVEVQVKQCTPSPAADCTGDAIDVLEWLIGTRRAKGRALC